MDPNPRTDTIERHLEVNRQAAQALAESVRECCQAAEKHLRPQESKRKEDEDTGGFGLKRHGLPHRSDPSGRS